jgi:hypothetical protein
LKYFFNSMKNGANSGFSLMNILPLMFACRYAPMKSYCLIFLFKDVAVAMNSLTVL